MSSLLEMYDNGNGNGGNVNNDNGNGIGGGEDDNFIKGSRYLMTKYTSWRMIRGDGNCYYRAFLYAVCEELLRGCFRCKDANTETNTDTNTNDKEYHKNELKRLETYGKFVIKNVRV